MGFSTQLMLQGVSIYTFFFFGHTKQLAGFQISDQGLNLGHTSESQNPNH